VSKGQLWGKLGEAEENKVRIVLLWFCVVWGCCFALDWGFGGWYFCCWFCFLKQTLAREQAVFNTGPCRFRARSRNQKLHALFPRALNSGPDGRHLITTCQKRIKECLGFGGGRKKMDVLEKDVKSGRQLAAVSTYYYILCHRHEVSCNSSAFAVAKQLPNGQQT